MRRRIAALTAAALLAACAHGEPPSAVLPADDVPFPAGQPQLLTRNPGTDQTPFFMPDGSRLIYSAVRSDRDGDACLQLLPPGGGRATDLLCHTFSPIESLNLLAWGSVTPGGRLLMARTTENKQAAGRIRRIVWGRVGQDPRDLHYTLAQIQPPVGPVLPTATFLRWLDERRIIYRQDYQFAQLISGRYLVIGDTEADDLDRVIVPNADWASSVAVLAPDTILWTRGGRSVIYRKTLSTGADTVLWDFGAAGIARDVHAAGGRIVAVVGGNVTWFFNPFVPDTLQDDQGGDLWVVDLGTQTAAPLAGGPLLFRHPVLAPDGRTVVASSGGDLYRFVVP